MSQHVITVCIFCFICATHSPCASHAATRHENILQQKQYHDPASLPSLDNLHISSREKRDLPNGNDTDNNNGGSKHRLVKHNSDNSSRSNSINGSEDYVKKIFAIYGDGDTMSIDNFEKLMLHLTQVIALKNDHDAIMESKIKEVEESTNASDKWCMDKDGVTSLIKRQTEESEINDTQFYKACPVLLYSVLAQNCHEKDNDFEEIDTPMVDGIVWLCSIVAVIIISACGVLSLAIIPVMQKKFYKPLIQFLVALAVGTLAGDALLHLLPHAMTSADSHHHNDHHSHDENTMKGCVAMLGLTFFFVMERLISLAGKWRKGKQKQKHSHVTVIKDRRESMHLKNNTQCMDKYNPIPFCYTDIMSNPHTIYESDRTATTVLDPGSNTDVHSCKKSRSPTLEKLEANQNIIECSGELNNMGVTEANKMLVAPLDHKHEDYTVILREHKSDHHGHSHKHGHVHAAPQNFSSVAWMVIMGDGLHNFTDGMAIGAAFSGGLAGGFSTTVAVFCHELPHELGDFAMLLKAGMSIKQALYYNILSSVLCIFGNIFGLALGNTEHASTWVFAAAAGMFIYIALVDMIPELSSAHEDEGNLMQCLLHLGGLLLGFGIMALIAFYEHDLKHIFNHSQ